MMLPVQATDKTVIGRIEKEVDSFSIFGGVTDFCYKAYRLPVSQSTTCR